MKTKKILFAFFTTLIMMGLGISMHAQDAAKPASGISWKSTTIDLGKIEKGKPVTVDFELTNPSMVPLIINDVRPSCGCTAANFPKEPVAPGKTAKISITYNAASTGAFTKSTAVYTNAAEGNSTLIIKGEVLSN